MARQPREKRSEVQAQGACVCGAVRFEIDVPAVWAWHDQQADWSYLGEPLGPLKGYPGVMIERPRKTRRRIVEDV